MYNLQKKTEYLFIKKDTSVLCALVCAMHIVLAPFCYYYGYDFICQYHMYISILYITMIAISKAIPKLFLFSLCYLETIAYTFIVTILYGNDAGSYIITLALLVYLFMISISSRASERKYIFTTVFSTVFTITEIIIVQIIDFTKQNAGNMFINKFYLLHYFIFSVTSILAICFISHIIRQNIFRFNEKNKMRNAFLNYSSTHDALTKIFNRRKIMQIINNFSTSAAYKDKIFALSIFDIDHFKKVNDTYGHNCGDAILKGMASLISRYLPGNTIFARWGGEEFIIMFTSEADSASDILENIRSRVQDYSFKYFTKTIKITITLGLSSTGKPESFQKMLIEADKNLIKGKNAGRNRVVSGSQGDEQS
ncbi:MAG: GGDEF domain-containing protein [Treponema sp.]